MFLLLKKINHKEFIRNNALILKTQQISGSERHNAFTVEVNKIASISNNDKRMNAIDWFDINICLWNKQRSSKLKKKRLNVTI